MKSTRSARLITDVISKRTTTTTTVTAKAAAAQQLNYYEPQCPHAVVQNDGSLSNSSPSVSISASSSAYQNVRPYSEVPGPTPLPILGNTWR